MGKAHAFPDLPRCKKWSLCFAHRDAGSKDFYCALLHRHYVKARKGWGFIPWQWGAEFVSEFQWYGEDETLAFVELLVHAVAGQNFLDG